VLAVLGMGKISEKGIMKEGYINPAQPAKQGLIKLYQTSKKMQYFL
jgi:hypothetical protein